MKTKLAKILAKTELTVAEQAAVIQAVILMSEENFDGFDASVKSRQRLCKKLVTVN